MANRKNWLGILVIVLVFGMMVVGCDDGSTSGGGSGKGNNLNEAINILKSWGYTGTFYTPDKGTFDWYYYSDDWDILDIIFKNSSLSDYTAYKNKWSMYIVDDSDYWKSITQARFEVSNWFDLALTDDISVEIFFTPVTIDIGYDTISANSIAFRVRREN